NGGFDGKFLPVSPQSAQGAQLPHGPGGTAGLPEMLDIVRVPMAEALGNETINRGAESAVGRKAKHALGGRIKQDNALLLINGDDCVHGGFENGRQLAPVPRQLFLGIPARGNILDDARGAKNPAGSVADDPDGDMDPDDLAVFAHVSFLDIV